MTSTDPLSWKIEWDQLDDSYEEICFLCQKYLGNLTYYIGDVDQNDGASGDSFGPWMRLDLIEAWWEINLTFY